MVTSRLSDRALPAHLATDFAPDAGRLMLENLPGRDLDISSGAVAVVTGALVENNLTIAVGSVETRIDAGKAISFGPITSTVSTAHGRARSPCTPTARRCGGWATTP